MPRLSTSNFVNSNCIISPSKIQSIEIYMLSKNFFWYQLRIPKAILPLVHCLIWRNKWEDEICSLSLTLPKPTIPCKGRWRQPIYGPVRFHFHQQNRKIRPCLTRLKSLFSIFPYLDTVFETDQCTQYIIHIAIATYWSKQLFSNFGRVCETTQNIGLNVTMPKNRYGAKQVNSVDELYRLKTTLTQKPMHKMKKEQKYSPARSKFFH